MLDHVIAAARLAKLLTEVENRWQGSAVAPNDVRNLAVLSATGQYVGYVDLDIGSVESFGADR